PAYRTGNLYTDRANGVPLLGPRHAVHAEKRRTVPARPADRPQEPGMGGELQRDQAIRQGEQAAHAGADRDGAPVALYRPRDLLPDCDATLRSQGALGA